MAWVLKMDEVIESGLVHDFDASLSGIGQELGAGAYSMRYQCPGAGGRKPPSPWERPARPWASARAMEPRGPLPTAVAGNGGRPRRFRPRGPLLRTTVLL